MDLRLTESIWLSTRTPSELIALIRAQAEWDDQAARNLDGAVTAMVGAALARSAPDLDELEDFQSLLRASGQHLPASCTARERHIARWDSLADCLRIRAELMVHGSYEAVSHMRHVPEILQVLASAGEHGRLQSNLQEQLGLQPANLTRILNTLENHRVVVRERKGKEKRVRLGVNAPVNSATTSPGSGKTAGNSGSMIFFPKTGTHG